METTNTPRNLPSAAHVRLWKRLRILHHFRALLDDEFVVEAKRACEGFEGIPPIAEFLARMPDEYRFARGLVDDAIRDISEQFRMLEAEGGN